MGVLMAETLLSFMDFIKSVMRPIDRIEESLLDLAIAFTIAHGVGKQLDVIGRRVGQPRNGLSDADYRVTLSARVLINRSTGCGADIKNIVLKFVPWLRIYDGGKVAMLDIDNQTQAKAQQVYDFVEEALDVTIRLQVLYSPQDDNTTFTFAKAAVTLSTITGGTVEVQGAMNLPDEGTVFVGVGTANEEIATYTNRTATHIYGLSTVNAHQVGTALQLTNNASQGFGHFPVDDLPDLGLGGRFATIIGS